MRYFCLAAFTGALALGLFSPPAAHAAGNVLLPSDDSSSDSFLPDLGLGLGLSQKPAGDARQSSAPAAAAPAADTATENGQNIPAPTPAYTPVPAPPQPPASAAAGTLPTRIIQIPVPDAASNSAQSALPSSLTVEIDKYVWGPADVYNISHSLGIPAEQIPAHCHLSVNGTFETDAGLYPFDTGVTHREVPLRYDGNPTGVTLRPAAVCDRLPLPPDVGTVFESGGKYIISLGQITCARPPRNPQRMVFVYGGNANGECVYQ